MTQLRTLTAALLGAAVLAGACTSSPTEPASSRTPAVRPAYDGGGYLGNGGRSGGPTPPPTQSAPTDSTGTPAAAAGGGYLGNGG